MMFLVEDDDDDGVVEELDASSCILARVASSGSFLDLTYYSWDSRGGLELEHFVTLYLRDDSSRLEPRALARFHQVALD